MRMYQYDKNLDFHALGREIKRKREEKGWTQEYLAQLVDRTPRSTVCFFRRNLPGQKRLPDLKEQCPARYGPACLCKVLTFYQKKLGGSRVRIAEIGRYGSQLFRVQAIGETILHRLNCTFSRRCFIRADVGGRRKNPSFRQTVFLLWDTLSRSRKSRGAVSTTPRMGQSSTSAESCFKRSDSGPHKAA